jgi:uncharacterized protein YjgD (DUF1641 family)
MGLTNCSKYVVLLVIVLTTIGLPLVSVYAQQDQDDKLKQIQKISEGVQKLNALVTSGELDEAQKLLEQMDEWAGEETMHVMLVQTSRMSLISGLIQNSKNLAAIQQHITVLTSLRKHSDDPPIRNILSISCEMLPELVKAIKLNNIAKGDNTKKYSKLIADEFGLVGGCISDIRKSVPQGTVNEDSKYIAQMIGVRQEIASFLTEKEQAVASTEAAIELKSLRKFNSEKPNDENGIYALEAILDSAASGYDFNSEEANNLFDEKEQVFLSALKNPDTSEAIGRAFSRVLSEKASRVGWSDAEAEKKLSSVIAQAEKLNKRFDGKFQQTEDSLKRTMEALIKSKEKKKRGSIPSSAT